MKDDLQAKVNHALSKKNTKKMELPVIALIAFMALVFIATRINAVIPSPTPEPTEKEYYDLSNANTAPPFVLKPDPTPETKSFTNPYLPNYKISIIKRELASYAELYHNNDKVYAKRLPIDPERIHSFWQTLDTLYTVLGIYTSDDSYEEIAKYTFKNNRFYKQLLHFENPGGYQGTIILDYTETNGALILRTYGGDGCGGSGKIWYIMDNQPQDVIQIGSGCVESTLPRFATYWNGDLYLSIQTGAYEVDTQTNKVYRLNPFTKEVHDVLTESQLPPGTTEVRSAEDPSVLEIYGQNGRKTGSFDLETNTFI